jgi:hypothetical protein
MALTSPRRLPPADTFGTRHTGVTAPATPTTGLPFLYLYECLLIVLAACSPDIWENFRITFP